MEHVLLTGAAGFAGSHLVSRLVGGGVRTTSFEGDVRDRESLRAAVAATEPDAVAHLAGVASVAESFGDPHGVWDVNATGTANVLLAVAAEAPDARVLVVSSAEVYGAVPERQQPIREERALAPRTPYGASKAAAEKRLRAACPSSTSSSPAPSATSARADRPLRGGLLRGADRRRGARRGGARAARRQPDACSAT